MKEFNPAWEGKIIFTEQNQHLYTGLSIDQLISLSGIKGYMNDTTEEKPVFDIDGLYPFLKFSIKYKEVTLFRDFDFEDRIIYNISFDTLKKREGVGTRVLRSQVSAAREIGFEEILCTALGYYNSKYNGYVTWGKLGYQMYKSGEITDFLKLMEEGRSQVNPNGYLYVDTLHQLLLNTDGTEYWTVRGSKWSGVFKLTPNSESLSVLNNYLTRKGLERI